MTLTNTGTTFATIEARDIQPGDCIWNDRHTGWWGPRVRKVERTASYVKILTVNGGEGILIADVQVKVQRDPILEVTLPYSEVCMHMQVAGKTMLVGPAANDPQRVMAQIFDAEGRKFSFPIGRGEAGYAQALTARQLP